MFGHCLEDVKGYTGTELSCWPGGATGFPLNSLRSALPTEENCCDGPGSWDILCLG